MTPRPGQIVCGEIGMRIDRHGVWHYRGSPINRKELVKLFSTVLRRDAAGEHWLITPAEMARIAVEDAPYLAVEMSVEGSGPDQSIRLRTNIDTEVSVDAEHPLRVETDPETGEPAPYVGLDHGLEARLNRPVFYEMVEHGVERECEGAHILGVWSNGHFFSLGALPPREGS
ncbi:MAG: DUF1285 domain-containing protein [Magnetovibrio sp.]|nr:DUF1285 domain-containing protein [Magnetovibrio sp.]